jgi:hypothetical protein
MAGACAVTGAIMGAGYALSDPPSAFHAEGGPVESLQAGGWFFSALLALAGVGRRKASRDRWWLLWLAVLALLAGARELDSHTWLNPAHLGDWGVHYRIDWWASPAAPLVPRLLWGAIFLALVLLLSVPPLLARARIPEFVLASDPGMWLLGITAACLGAGWFSDDILRPLRAVHDVIQGAEETFELLGAAAFLGTVVFSIRTPMRTRAERAAEFVPTLRPRS